MNSNHELIKAARRLAAAGGGSDAVSRAVTGDRGSGLVLWQRSDFARTVSA